MAWITEQSSNTKVESRKEPYLTPDLLKTITKEIMPRYATGKGALMTTLHEVQDVYGFVAWQAMGEIANVLGISAAEVADVVSFYEDYHSEPLGKNIVGICQSIACEICGHQVLIDHLRDRLGVEVHETSADGQFTILGMECIGSCDNAPCALINGKQYNNLSVSKIDEIIDRLEKE